MKEQAETTKTAERLNAMNNPTLISEGLIPLHLLLLFSS